MKRLLISAALIAHIAFPNMAEAQETAPTMLSLSTGSEVATWTLQPEKKTHTTPVVFLHGGPGMYTTPGVMARGATFRSAGFATIYFDQAGGGKSKKLAARDYTIDRAVADLEALRIATGQNKMILWGNSYGASLATLYANRFPDRVAGIILTSPGSYPGTHAAHNYSKSNRGKIKLGKALSDAVNAVDRDGAAAEAKLSQAEAGRLFDELANADMMSAMVCKGSTIAPPKPGSGGNLYANRLIGKNLDTITFKANSVLKVPALILRGSCDFLPESNAASFAKLLGISVTTIPNTGHGFLENPTAIEAEFSAFAKGALAAVE